jgi:hypothetical protein
LPQTVTSSAMGMASFSPTSPRSQASGTGTPHTVLAQMAAQMTPQSSVADSATSNSGRQPQPMFRQPNTSYGNYLGQVAILPLRPDPSVQPRYHTCMLSPSVSVSQQHVTGIHKQASEKHDESEIIPTTSHQQSTDSEEPLIEVFYECAEADEEDDVDVFYECCEHCDTDRDTSASLLELTEMTSPCEHSKTPAEAPVFSTETPALLDSEEDVGDKCVMHAALTGRLFSQVWTTVCFTYDNSNNLLQLARSVYACGIFCDCLCPYLHDPSAGHAQLSSTCAFSHASAV